MERCITQVGGKIVFFDKGKKDEWCVYVDTIDRTEKYAPRDEEYFTTLFNYSLKYGRDRVYNDFMYIYNMVTKNYSVDDTVKIIEKSKEYGDDCNEISVIFMILYMGMISEENFKWTKLGKRIKLLGIYQVLIEGLSPSYAANFSKEKGWREIDAICKERGF